MSKNRKNSRKIQAKRDMRSNKPGPKRTESKHGKKNTWHAKLAGKVANTPAPKRRRDEDTDE